MHPVLFKIGPLTIHTYGVLVASGFLLGLGLAVRRARKEGIPSDKIVDLGFYILLSAIIGSRLFFILMNAGYYLKNPLEILKIWEGGLVFYGGLILAIPTAVWYVKKNTLGVWNTADLFAPSIAIGHAMGRIGCFFAGCCYGKPSEGLPWAVTFTDSQSLAMTGVPLHPTQLYESMGEFISFLLLVILRKYKSFNGQLFLTYILLYSVLRFIVEFYRGDVDRGFITSQLSLAQGISILMFLVAVAGLVILRQRKVRLRRKGKT
ncbi:MAG: prolipoprotein diacylglyceryl transferase [Thermodesulfovibrionales bacterium]|nr:prolipoprotein diacylglyceryl transferase [Thermodesulfovibrionales bacterium]